MSADTFSQSILLAWQLVGGGNAELWRVVALSLRVSLTAVWNATHHIYVEPDARRALQLARLR